jgi:hypothetical protein
MLNRIPWTCLVALCLPTTPLPAAAPVWQWSIDVAGDVSAETGALPRAFLWIPEDCQRVRAVVVAQHNIEEELILEHPRFRRQLQELGIAAIWISPPLDHVFRFDLGTGQRFDGMMDALAAESGYLELKHVPVVPIGHSAAASFPWNFAAWNPVRTLAAISISGQWPYWSDPSMPDWGDRTIDGVPGLVTMGEYEWAEERADEGLRQRAAHAMVPLTMLAEPGAGHFDVSATKIEFLSLYLRKVCEHRLWAEDAADTPAPLRPIDPSREGWLVERWHRDAPPKHAAAPVARYTGNPNDAFWCFDEELARAVEVVGARDRGKQTQLLGFEQAGKAAPQDAKTHQQVTLQFLPNDDGTTFELRGTFLAAVPPGRPERWTGKDAGTSIDHGNDPQAIEISRICGPVRRLDSRRFAVRFDRLGFNNRKRGGEIWLVAEHPRDARFRRSVQQALMRIPITNDSGQAQHVTFPKIEDCASDAGPIQLRATSSSGAAVQYYIVSGPAEVHGDVLHFTTIPPHSRLPMKVTVVAYQWGRSRPPLLQSAEPVEQSFWVNRAPFAKPFVHPGLLHTRADLDRMRQRVAAGAEPWRSGFEQLANHWQSQADYELLGPHPRVVRDPRESLFNTAMVADGNAAYQNALMWCIIEEEAHARKAIEILNAWAYTLQEMDGRDVQLGAGLNGFKFVNAAELMRATHPKWSNSEVARCQRMFKQVIYPPIKDFATFANGNWDGACIKTIMAIGVFCDDRAIFERGVDYYYHGAGNGRLTHYVVNNTGQCQESGRDQGHAQLGLGQLAEACEIGWNQGLDMYGASNNRLLAGFEYTAKYLLGHNVPFVKHTDTTGKYTAEGISPRGRNRIRPIYEMVRGHYENRGGLDVPHTRAVADRIRPEGPAHAADHPGFGTLLFYQGH